METKKIIIISASELLREFFALKRKALDFLLIALKNLSVLIMIYLIMILPL